MFSRFFSNPVVRSTLISFITALALAVSATDFAWTQSALVAAAIAAARTALSALLPGGSFGYGTAAAPNEPDSGQ